MTAADLPELRAILQNPKAMLAYEGSFTDDEVTAWLAKQQASYRRHGFGLWAVELRHPASEVERGKLIGQCGITYQDIGGQRVLEVGYLFNPAYWHHGYAAEAARACRDYAFTALGAEEVFSQVRDTNLASMNVAIRQEMTIKSRFSKFYRGVEMPHYAFSITRNEWEKHNSTELRPC
jgi:[ribosomal protein S5]-alanine N-acetyltransferase